MSTLRKKFSESLGLSGLALLLEDSNENYIKWLEKDVTDLNVHVVELEETINSIRQIPMRDLERRRLVEVFER